MPLCISPWTCYLFNITFVSQDFQCLTNPFFFSASNLWAALTPQVEDILNIREKEPEDSVDRTRGRKREASPHDLDGNAARRKLFEKEEEEKKEHEQRRREELKAKFRREALQELELEEKARRDREQKEALEKALKRKEEDELREMMRQQVRNEQEKQKLKEKNEAPKTPPAEAADGENAKDEEAGSRLLQQVSHRGVEEH